MEKEQETHYGQAIKRKLEERGMSVAEFARRIYCTRENVYNIFERPSLSTDLLKKASQALDFDFLHEL
jgi:transcriptional regulator with XRE-family HTH domain